MTTADVTDEDTLRVKTVDEVQDELVTYLVDLVPYWINTNLDWRKNNITYRLAGMAHSLHAGFSGSSGGFSPSIDMYPFSTEEEANRLASEGKNFFVASVDNSSDINNGGLKYHSGDKYAPVPENSNPPREWDPDEARSLFLNKLADLLHAAVSKEELSDLEKGAYFMRSLLDLFENGSEDFPKVMLLAVTSPEDEEYYIENGENYYHEEGTQLTGQKRSLVEIWDFYWDRIVRRNAGLYVKPMYQG